MNKYFCKNCRKEFYGYGKRIFCSYDCKYNFPLTYDKKELIKSLYLNGENLSSIAERFKLNRVTIFYILKKMKVKMRDFKFKKGDIPHNKGKNKLNYPPLMKVGLKVSKAHLDRGNSKLDRNGRWRGGVSFEPYGIDFNISIRNMIRNRDNQICMNCGIHREKLKRSLEIHHINYDKRCNFEQNFISLCKSCHSLTNSNREYWTKVFQDKLSKLYNYNYVDGKIVMEVKNVT